LGGQGHALIGGRTFKGGRDRSRFIENGSIDLGELFDGQSVFKVEFFTTKDAEKVPQGKGGGQGYRTGAGDDQHGGKDVQCLARVEKEPKSGRRKSDKQHGDRKPLSDAVRQCPKLALGIVLENGIAP